MPKTLDWAAREIEGFSRNDAARGRNRVGPLSSRCPRSNSGGRQAPR